MQGHPTGALFALALGDVRPARRRALRAHLRGCAACRLRLRHCRDEVALLALGLAPAKAPTLLREGVRHALGETDRFRPLMATLAALSGLSSAALEAALLQIDRRGAWRRRRADGTSVMRIPARPDLALMRLAPGHSVPVASGGWAMLLQGACIDTAGTRVGPGHLWRHGSARAAHANHDGGASAVLCVAQPRHQAHRPKIVENAPDEQ